MHAARLPRPRGAPHSLPAERLTGDSPMRHPAPAATACGPRPGRAAGYRKGGRYFTVMFPLIVSIFTLLPPPFTAPAARMYFRGVPLS